MSKPVPLGERTNFIANEHDILTIMGAENAVVQKRLAQNSYLYRVTGGGE